MTKKTPYHHGGLRDALVAAVVTQIERGGPDGVSLRAAAREVGVSPAATFRHFPDKRAVMTAIATAGFDGMADRMAIEVGKATTDLQRFGAVGRGYLTYALENRAHFRVMFRADLLDAADPSLTGAGARVLGALSDGLAPVLPDGVSPEEVRQRSLLGWAAVHGVATLHIEGALPPEMAPDGPPDLARALGAMLPVFVAPPEATPPGTTA